MIPFDAILAALTPVFVLILAGHVMKRTGFPGEGFWGPAEKLTYYMLFPALLVNNLVAAPLASTRFGPFALVLAGSVLVVTFGLLLLRRWLTTDDPGFSSLMQGGIRFNTYVGLAASQALFGMHGLTLAAIVIAVLVPLINVLCVATLSHYGSAGRLGWGSLLRGLAGNPLILACLAGILLNVTGIGLPWGSSNVLEIIGRAALPLGLLAVGAGLDAGAIRGHRAAIGVVTAIKLIALPLVVAGAARLLALPPVETAIAVLFAALPTAPSAYILARQMGGDSQLMAGLLTLQTVAAVLTLPLMLALLG
ncbi:MAG: AEC family transporter [Gammaproteobacteria bacterium]|nr:MAG: AEC family transporter [Gammaproteobacteria bacterium]